MKTSLLLSMLPVVILPGPPGTGFSTESLGRTPGRNYSEARGAEEITWRRQNYRDYFTKAMKEPAFITRVLKLTPRERTRAEKLLASGIVRKTLLEGCHSGGSVFCMEKFSGYARIAGPSELVVGLQTMIEDDLTFFFITRDRASENTIAVLSVVDPDFLQKGRRVASQIAEDSYEAIRRMLKPERGDYRRAGKQVWLNRDIGTVTIFDRPEMIEKVREYLAMRPYAPRRKRY